MKEGHIYVIIEYYGDEHSKTEWKERHSEGELRERPEFSLCVSKLDRLRIPALVWKT